jgi:uncharacterized tellurite resistance protein B-like protein
MDYTFLVDRIKKQLQELEPEKQPLCVIRGSGGFNNEAGESYVIPYENTVYLYNRKFSEYEFNARCVEVSDIDELKLERETFSAELILQAGSQTLRLKISGAEIPNTEMMVEHFEKNIIVEQPQEAVVSGKQVDSEAVEITPMIGFAASLMFTAAVDGSIAEEEQQYIEKLCGLDQEAYLAAYNYYQNKSLEELLDSLELDEQQKLCYLANIIELAMIDGVFDSKEQGIIQSFTDVFGIKESQVRMIEDVLLMKNQLSVLE